MIISHFLRHMDLVIKMIVFVLFVFVFIQSTPAIAVEESREELVKWGGYGEDKLSTVVIGGKLLCSSAGSHAKIANNPYPVSGASVAVFCGTSVGTKKSWAKGSTDRYGEFLIDLPSHLHAIPNLEKICVVKVVHLPQSSPCRHGFTGKHKGIKLTSIGEGVRFYTTHDIHLMLKPSQEHVRKGSKTKHTVSVL